MKILAWVRRGGVVGTALSVVGVVLILIVHYSSRMHPLGLHDVLRRLFYIPIITAAIAGGKRGALIAAAVATASYVPHLYQLAAAGDRIVDSVLELVLLPVVGLLVGGFADSSRRAKIMAAERSRLAALGEVAAVLIAQIEGPLASIGGQAESLRFLAGRTESRADGFAAEVIHRELARTRRFLLDISGLGRPANRRVRHVDLSALLIGIAREIRRTSLGRDRLTIDGSPKRVLVEADRGVLSYALRSLLLGLLDGVPRASRIGAGVREETDAVTVELSVVSEVGVLPNLERSISAVFGAGIDEYNFKQALCVHLVKAEGASLSSRRVSEREELVQVRFCRAEGRAQARRPLPTFNEAEAWIGSGGGRA